MHTIEQLESHRLEILEGESLFDGPDSLSNLISAQSLSDLPRVNHDTEGGRLNLHASDEVGADLLGLLNHLVGCVAIAYNHLMCFLLRHLIDVILRTSNVEIFFVWPPFSKIVIATWTMKIITSCDQFWMIAFFVKSTAGFGSTLLTRFLGHNDISFGGLSTTQFVGFFFCIIWHNCHQQWITSQ